MTDTPEPSRKELKDQLAASTAELEKERADRTALETRLARLESAFAAKADSTVFSEIDLARLKAAKEELESLRPGSDREVPAPQGPAPKQVPYSGLVRALTKCATDIFHEPGEVFFVTVATLWSDDPYEPVKEVADGEYAPRTDVTIVNYRFRKRAADMGLMAANQV